MNLEQIKELWSTEEQFWLGDADFYESTLAPNALMVLPQPAGVLDRAATIDSVRSGVRWQHIRFTYKHQRSSGVDLAVLVYVAHADRGGPDTSYVAQCSSTYVCDGARWLLALHHQTPAGGARVARVIRAEADSNSA